MANLDPRVKIGRIYKGHCFTQIINALGLMVSEKKIFFNFFSYYKSMEANVANLVPRGMIGRIYEENH